MYGPKMRSVIVVTFVFLGFILWSGCAVDGHDGGAEMDQDTLVGLARKVAVEHKVDVDNCEVHLKKKGEDTIVEFWPRNPNQVGGGARLFFKQKNDGYGFSKIELWQ